MKGKRVLLLFGLLLSSVIIHAAPLGTTFTYQGRLTDNGTPANGQYDLRFILFDVDSFGFPIGPVLTNANVGISGGLFTVILDFGADVFTGGARWLDIGVRTNGSLASFARLEPRQPLTPAPYAITAGAISGGLPAGTYSNAMNFNNSANSFRGSFLGNGVGLTNVNAATLGGLRASNFWLLGGNTGTTPGLHFLGTGDNQPLEFKVRGQRSFRMEPSSPTVVDGGVSAIYSNAPNLIGGAVVNVVDPGVAGAFIGGGGLSAGFVDRGSGYEFVGSFPQRISALFGTISGGLANRIGTNAAAAWIGGGQDNTIQTSAYATISGGLGNIVSNGYSSTIAGGFLNIASGHAAAVAGGINNFADGRASLAAGNRARALYDGDFVWADSQSADFASTAADQFCVRARGGVQFNGDTSIYFGSQTRQMLNLWGSVYGIGVQGGTHYFRTDGNFPGAGFFAWYRGGTHDDRALNAGSGQTLMTLTLSGLTVNGTFVSTSDRAAKENIQPVDTRDILTKVVALPIARWQYTNDPGVRHIGPMGQDFHAAFGVGPDEKHIATIDADGVALAAIQGLNQKLEEELRAKDAELQSLQRRLAALERLIQNRE